MTTQLLLELKKNRLLFIGLAAIFWPSLALAAWGYRLSGQAAMTGLDAALTFWTLAGPAGFALLFGASGGVGLAAERDAEDVLPLSPRQRVFCSLAADAVHIVLLALLILLTAFILSPAWREFLIEAAPQIMDWNFAAPENPLTRAFFRFGGFTTAYVLLMSFLFAHWLRHGMFGGMLSLILAAPAVGAFTAATSLNLLCDFELFGWTAPIAALAALAALLPALELVPRWCARQKKPPLGRLAAVLGLVLAAPALLPVLFWRLNVAAQTRLLLAPATISPSADRLLPKAREASLQGALLISARSDVAWITPDGRRRLLREGRPLGLLETPMRPDYCQHQTELGFDDDGTVWALLRPHGSGPAELWHGAVDRTLEPRWSDGRAGWINLTRRGPVLGLSQWDKDDELFAPVPKDGKQPVWQKRRGYPHEDDARSWVRAGLGATASKDRRGLDYTDAKGRRTTWRLPGKGLPSAHTGRTYFPYELGGRRVFLVPVALGEHVAALAVCFPDGSVKTVWRGLAPLDLEDLPDGTVSAWGRDQVLHVALPDGTFLLPVSLTAAFTTGGAAPRNRWQPGVLLHREGMTGWVMPWDREQPLNSDRMLKVDLATGRLIESRPLPAHRQTPEEWRMTSPARDGVFYQVRDRLYFIPWEGPARDLGRV